MQARTEIEIEIEVAKLVGVLAACFPTVQMSDASINAYVVMLKDIPVEVLKAAVEQSIAESEFLPTIAKLRDKAFVLSSSVSQMPSAFEAWGIVLKEMQQRGFYRSPQFENSIIAKAVEAIGWRALCVSENQVADRAHFVKVYESLVLREIQNAKLLPTVRRLVQQSAERVQIEGGVH